MSDELLDRARRAAVSPNYWPSGDLGEILVALIARLDAAEREVERLRGERDEALARIERMARFPGPTYPRLAAATPTEGETDDPR